jgi:hypothetical protein
VAKELGVALIDACSAVEQVLQGISHLSRDVRQALRTGQPLREDLVAECVCAVALRYPAWVLDAFPATPEQANVLAKRDVGITRVLILEADDATSKARAEAELLGKDAGGRWLFPTPASSVPDTRPGADEGATVELLGAEAQLTGEKAVEPALELWKNKHAAIREALSSHRDTHASVSAHGNRTLVERTVHHLLAAPALGRQAFLEKRRRGHPAPMLHQGLWMDRDELVRRRGRFSRAGGGALGGDGGTHFTCFTSTKVQILTPAELRGRRRLLPCLLEARPAARPGAPRPCPLHHALHWERGGVCVRETSARAALVAQLLPRWRALARRLAAQARAG